MSMMDYNHEQARKNWGGRQRLVAPKEWVGLTDEEIDQLLPEIVNGGTFTVITYGRAVARAIEVKLKEKNNG